jgi:hypothetical protein
MFTVVFFQPLTEQVSVLRPSKQSNKDYHFELRDILSLFIPQYKEDGIPKSVYETMPQYNELEGFLVFSRPGDWLEIKYEGAIVARFIHVKPPRVKPWSQRMVLHATK